MYDIQTHQGDSWKNWNVLETAEGIHILDSHEIIYFPLFCRCRVLFENTEMVGMLVASSTDTMSFGYVYKVLW